MSALRLDPIAFPNAAFLTANGRLTVTRSLGDTDGDGDYDQLYVPGGRSFSIWDTDGRLVFDSGDAFERITAQRHPTFFNASHNNNTFDDRSDNKGPGAGRRHARRDRRPHLRVHRSRAHQRRHGL